jgi:hypothetical protein
LKFFFRGEFFFFGFSFAWLIGPGIFGGNCPLGNFKGKYAGRFGRQSWKSLIFCPFKEVPLSHPRVDPTTCKKKKKFVFLFFSNVVELIGPGIFRGNCPLGNFKGRYAGRIGKQDWKSLDLFFP